MTEQRTRSPGYDPGVDGVTTTVDPVGDEIHHHVIWRRRLVVAIAAVGVAIIGIVIAIVVLAVGNEPPQQSASAAAPTTATTTTAATTTTSRPASTTTAATTTAPPAPQATPPADTGGSGAGTSTYVYPMVPASQGKYSKSHHDYPASDMFASCGTSFVSPVSGQVQDVSRKDTWNSKVNDGATRGGISVSVVGDDGVRYYGSHLQSVEAGIDPGVRVKAGQLLGRVGETGSAKGTGCHLHFGISKPTGSGDWEVRRGTVYPWPYLDSWRDGGQMSPVDEVLR